MSDEDLIRRGDAQSHMQAWEENDHDRREPSLVIADIPAVQMTVKPCGGCGERDPQKRCIGCFHDFGTPDSAWVRKYQEHGDAIPTEPAPDAAKVAALVAAAEAVLALDKSIGTRSTVHDMLDAALAVMKEG